MSVAAVGVVVVNWNLVDDTLACLASLLEMTYPAFQVVVVDNGSTDGSPERICAAYPRVAQIVNQENRGFAAGANQGLEWALARGCAYVLVLNNDTVVAPDLLNRLVAAAETDPRIGVLSPRILHFGQPERTWHLAARWHRWLPMPVNIWEAEGDLVEADFVSGCAMMLRRAVLERIGGFDSGYYMYGEDIDLCARAKQVGYRVVAVPTAQVWHKVSLSSRKVSVQMRYWRTRNQILVYRRYLDGFRRRLLPGYVLLKAMNDLARDVRQGQVALVGPLLRGVRDGLWGALP